MYGNRRFGRPRDWKAASRCWGMIAFDANAEHVITFTEIMDWDY